ncbi:MAG: diacylglycerol kinase family protein [Actinomycetota bacterium]
MAVLVLGNPAAAGFDAEARAAIARELGAVEWLDVSGDSTGAGLREAARATRLVVVAGGDGTLNHAVNALADRLGDVTFGLVPAGTGNDFARTAAIPADPADAARAVASGTPRPFDVSRASGGGASRLFVNACMGGFPVEVDEAIDEDTKRRLGALAFWAGGAKRAATGVPRWSVTINGVEVPDCVAVGVGNGRTCGGGVAVWPRADPSDGRLDACGLGARGAAAAIRLLLNVSRAAHEGLDGVHTTSAPRIDIDSDPPVELNVDGELVGLRSPARFEVVGSFRLLVA